MLQPLLITLYTDSIEANVQTAEISVESGTQELQKAREYQVCQPKPIMKLVLVIRWLVW